MFPLVAIFAGVAIAATAASWLLDSLTEEEKERQNQLNNELSDLKNKFNLEVDSSNQNMYEIARSNFDNIKNKFLEMFILKGSKWEPVEPFVKMVKSKVYYGKGRKMRVDKLAEFLEIYINKIEDAKDFRAFCKLFESVVGYFYGISRK